MKCFLVLAAFLALSSATTVFRGRDITVDPQGRVVITGYEGKQIAWKNVDGKRYVEIVEPNRPNRMIEIVDDDVSNTYDKTDVVIGTKNSHRYIVHLINKLQDVLDEQSYHDLVKSVDNAYNNGHYTNNKYDLERRIVDNIIRDNQAVHDGVYNKYHGVGLYGKHNDVEYNRYAPQYQRRHNVYDYDYDYYGNRDTTRYNWDTTRYNTDRDTTHYGMDVTRYVNPYYQHYYNRVARQPVYNHYYQHYDNVVPSTHEYYNQVPTRYHYQDKSTIRDVIDRVMRGDSVTDRTYPVHHVYGNGYGYGYHHQQPYAYQHERVHQYEPVVAQIAY